MGLGLKCTCSQRSHIHAHRLIYSMYKPSSYTICPRDPYPLVQICKFRGGRNPSDLCSGDPYPQSTPGDPYPQGTPGDPYPQGTPGTIFPRGFKADLICTRRKSLLGQNIQEYSTPITHSPTQKVFV